jgi:Zn-dependent peptidase ImmA (M78 family)
MRRENAALARARRTEKPDLIELCDVFDVAVREQRMDDDLCGWIEEYDFLDSRRCRIVVNSAHVEWRRRFTIAVMLGHHHYHRDLFDRRAGRGANAGRSYVQIEDSPRWNPAINAACERRASVFAIQLLMAGDTMLRLVGEGLDAQAIAKRLCVSEKVAQKRIETLHG